MAPKIAPENEFLPFATFLVTGTNVSLPLISLFYQPASPTPTFNASVIKKIKSYLSKGIVVVGGMDVSMNQFKFSTYGGGVLEQECTQFKLNHQVVFVGYGRLQGKDVWMIRNSYGEQWGANGYFYVPIGSNSFCTEMEATIIIPKHFINSLYENIGNHSNR